MFQKYDLVKLLNDDMTTYTFIDESMNSKLAYVQRPYTDTYITLPMRDLVYVAHN